MMRNHFATEKKMLENFWAFLDFEISVGGEGEEGEGNLENIRVGGSNFIIFLFAIDTKNYVSAPAV